MYVATVSINCPKLERVKRMPDHEPTAARRAADVNRLVDDYSETILRSALDNLQSDLLWPVLMAAAKWAAKGCCPSETRDDACPRGNFFCTKHTDENHVAQCWIEYWKKEAEG